MKYFVVLLLSLSCTAMAADSDALNINVIDTDGGHAVLIVTPSGESLLLDAGNPCRKGADSCDADRIVAAARKLGVSRIDYLLLTHYHVDHIGVPDLAERIPIVNFLDHGQNTEAGGKWSKGLDDAYYKVREKGKHTILKPGDTIPIKGLDVQVVSSRGELIDEPLPGAGSANPFCASCEPKNEEKVDPENFMSVGVLVTFGEFRYIDLGDLTWNHELKLACPVNKIGEADLYLSTHHGLDQSGSPAIVHALHPRVAIMNNGYRKGGAASSWQTIKDSPDLEGLWQLHYASRAGETHNMPEKYISNMEKVTQGHGVSVLAQADGTFTVTNERNGYQETYKPNRQ